VSTAGGRELLATVFGRLFESELGSVEALRVSVRGPNGGIVTMDERAGLGALLGEAGHPEPAPDPLHADLLAIFPAWTAAVSGVGLHLRDLLAEGMALPETTSMMRKRMVVDLADHLVEPAEMAPDRRQATLARARERVERVGAKHVLLVVTDGTVHVAGRTPEETMAHWSNVEFSARTHVARIEERLVHVAVG
jgi:hypothetical protein